MEKYLSYLKFFILYSLIFLFPLFFLPFTQEFFVTGKLYLLAFGTLALLLISTLQFLMFKKLTWKSLPYDTPVVLFLITIALSTIISSPNKIQALLNPNFGLAMLFSLTVLYFYLSRVGTIHELSLRVLSISSVLLSILTIIFFFQPFKNLNLPQSLQFLKNPNFTPMGSQLDLAIFLGFFVVYGLTVILGRTRKSAGTTPESDSGQARMTTIFNFSLLTFNLIALSLTLYSLLKPISTNSVRTGLDLSLQLPPLRLSWYAAVETLKNPLTALFGVGVDNFASLFTRIKDFAYNQSNLWQINSFGVSRSTILHIFSETGVFGLISFFLVLISLVKVAFLNKEKNPSQLFVIGYLSLAMFLFPPSLPMFFLFFLTLATIHTNNESLITNNGQKIELSNLMPVYLGIIIISFAFIAGTSYLLSRSYAAEYSFKKALDGFANNDAKQVYDNMRQAIILNPYIERFRINFSQTNLLIANNIASARQSPTGEGGPASPSAQLTDQDRQNISQGIQAAIAEAKAAVSLNSQKASNWENLAVVYRNILNVAQGADVWTISAYQRAIVADPQNPIYRLNLGGVYYSLGNYEEAVKLFEQSVGLKPDWSNAHYNLAWALYQRKDYQRAASEMQNVSQLVDPKSEDAKKVQKDLEDFKKMLPEEEATAAGELKPGQLSLPTPPVATFEPKIQLPKEASPEAK